MRRMDMYNTFLIYVFIRRIFTVQGEFAGYNDLCLARVLNSISKIRGDSIKPNLITKAFASA